MDGTGATTEPILNYRPKAFLLLIPFLFDRPTDNDPLFISLGLEKSDNGCVRVRPSVALCGDVNTFHSNSSLSLRRIPKGEEREKEGEASDFTGKSGESEGGREARRVEWNRHTFLAMFAAMTIYLSADRASLV